MIKDRTLKNNSYLIEYKFNFNYKKAFIKDTFFYHGNFDAWYWFKESCDHVTGPGYYIF